MKQKRSWCDIKPGKPNYWRQSYLHMLKTKIAVSSTMTSRFLCLILHKTWLCCSLQSSEEMEYKKAHPNTNQCLGRNNLSDVLKTLINFPSQHCYYTETIPRAVLANTVSYSEIQSAFIFLILTLKKNDTLLYNLIFDPLKRMSVEI